MFLVSKIIDSYCLSRLKNKKFRNTIFQSALRNELRNKKIGKAFLRNLNELMNSDTSIHNEFAEIVGEENFQTRFWESDLGYLWFEGNANANKPYFNEAIRIANKNNVNSLLDVGCGWGIFCNKCVGETKIQHIKGIDISEGVIENAKKKFANERLSFELKDIESTSDRHDMLTIFGSIDYVVPSKIERFVMKMIELANKNVIIVNSLRKVSLQDSLDLKESKEIKRYDIGYVHPLNEILKENMQNGNYTYIMEKSGIDSVMVIITK